MKTARNLFQGQTYILEDGRKVVYKGLIAADGHYINVVGKETESEECLPHLTKFLLPSQQRKFTSQFEIEAEVIKLKRKLLSEHKLAQKHETLMRGHWDKANDTQRDPHSQVHFRQKGFTEKKLMERNLNNIRRIEDVKLPKLKNALASFKTKTFAFSDADRSVCVN